MKKGYNAMHAIDLGTFTFQCRNMRTETQRGESEISQHGGRIAN